MQGACSWRGLGRIGLYPWEAEKGEPEYARLGSWEKWSGSGLSRREAAGGWNRDVQFQRQAELCEGILAGRRRELWPVPC